MAPGTARRCPDAPTSRTKRKPAFGGRTQLSRRQRMATLALTLALTLGADAGDAGLAPLTDLATLPVAYWGGSWSPRPLANLEMLAKMSYVVIEKWEGPCWPQCMENQSHNVACSASCHEEAHQLATLGAIKKLNSIVPKIFYLNALLDFNFLSLHRQFIQADALLRNTDGSICHLTNDGNMTNVTVYDFSMASARALWVDTVRNLTATGLVDGIYADQAQVFAEQDAESGNWSICKRSHGTCCEMTAAKAWAFNVGRTSVLQQVADLLGPGALLCAGGPTAVVNCEVVRPGDDQHNPQKLARAIQQVLRNKTYAHVVEKLSGPGGDQKGDHNPANIGSECSPDMIASFMLALEPGAFLSCDGESD